MYSVLHRCTSYTVLLPRDLVTKISLGRELLERLGEPRLAQAQGLSKLEKKVHATRYTRDSKKFILREKPSSDSLGFFEVCCLVYFLAAQSSSIPLVVLPSVRLHTL